MADIAGHRIDVASRAAKFEVRRREEAPVVTARILHRDAEKAAREARRLGGVFDPVEQVWLFRATSAFELRGGAMELRLAGLLPLEMRYGDEVAAIWVDFDFGRRVMQWRPIGNATRRRLVRR
jgi:hypothetical protein